MSLTKKEEKKALRHEMAQNNPNFAEKKKNDGKHKIYTGKI
ncbi:MAG: hypothetical protein ACI3ZY_13505 [Parabacteroides sp.]